MLKIVANALLKEFPFKQVFRIDGDEFVVISEDANEKECELRMEHVTEEVKSHGYYLAYGIAHRENETGADRIAIEADDKMLNHKRNFYLEQNLRLPRWDER